MDNEFKQSNREAKATLWVYFAYFVWSISFAYGLGSGSPLEYSYVLGFPSWFFFSCILGYPLCCLLLYVVIQKVFKQTDLNTVSEDTHE